MSDPVPTGKGWYPDSETGGTKYRDGRSGVLGDVEFAAAKAKPLGL